MDQLNFRNKYVELEEIEDIFKRGGINCKPNNIDYYQKSFTNFSYAKDFNYSFLKQEFVFGSNFVDFQKESNERYEFAGDSFINNTVCEYLFERYEDKDEGFLTKLKTKIVSKECLSLFGKYLGLDNYVLLSNHMENLNGRDSDRVLEDTFESFIYAMIKDSIPRKIVREFVINVMEKNIAFSELIFNNANYKDRLKKFSQKKNLDLTFELTSVLGSPLQRSYVVTCYLGNQEMKSGLGKNKKEAEHEASIKTLIMLNEISLEEQIYIINNK